MLAAIDFDDQPRVQAGKVDNVVVDQYLPTEAKPIDLALAQEAPQGALRVRHIVAEAAAFWFGIGAAATPHPASAKLTPFAKPSQPSPGGKRVTGRSLEAEPGRPA
jgi:hypothetical protein